MNPGIVAGGLLGAALLGGTLWGLVAPSGKLACVVEGSVEERDYPQVLAYLK